MTDEEPKYRDRNEGYIPEPSFGELTPSFNTLVGNPYQERHPLTTLPVAFAKPDELNRRVGPWMWAQIYPGSAEEPEHWSHFEGWDVRVGISLVTWNSREVNDWKGRDEIRKEGEWTLTFNEQVVAGGWVRKDDAFKTFEHIRRTAEKLKSSPVDWRKDDYKSQIEGRRVYYRDTPGMMYHWMPDQNCVMIRACKGFVFPPRAYDIDNQTGTDDNPEHNYSDEFSHEVKIELTSSDIWWWRDRKFGDE